jgi:hypothetical protein
MRTTHRLAALGALAALTVSLTACSTVFPATAAPVAAAPGAAQPPGTDSDSLSAIGLTADGVLVEFDTNDPAAARELGEVTGLEDDDRLVGIDYRVQDGKLYGVGDQGGIYTIDGAAATKVKQLSEDLDGEVFGVDFNPAANALRIISDTGQNLRQPFATEDAPTAEDTELTNPAAPPATGTTPATGVTAVGYTNNDTDQATGTTLFDLDTKADRIAIQSPANAGTLAPAGGLGADVSLAAGLDIYSTLDGERTVDNDAYATVEVDGTRKLWAVDLLTGVATDKGEFGQEVVDLAVKLEQ